MTENNGNELFTIEQHDQSDKNDEEIKEDSKIVSQKSIYKIAANITNDNYKKNSVSRASEFDKAIQELGLDQDSNQYERSLFDESQASFNKLMKDLDFES